MSTRKNEAKWIDARQRWQINVQHDGKRRTFTSSVPGIKGKIAAEKAADAWLESELVNENTRVSVLLDKWVKKLELSASSVHYGQYEGYVRLWIRPRIGMRKIDKLTQNDLQSVIDNAYRDGKLAKKTLENIRGCLMGFIKYCRFEKATTFHPETLTIPASAKHSEKTIVPLAGIKTLFTTSTTKYHNKLIEDRYIHAYRFAVLTGMRPGELIALYPSDINGSRVKILRSINDKRKMTHCKNDNARRVYMLDRHALSVLHDQRRMLNRLGEISPYVFPGIGRDFVKQQTLRKAWKRYCETNGIKQALTPYELRHTFVSVNAQMPSALKKLVVGHGENMDTDGIYSHEKTGDMETAAGYISAAFAEILGW